MKLAQQGAVIVLIGALTAWGVSTIPGGSETEVWSGLLPGLIAVGLVLIGGVMIALGLTRERPGVPLDEENAATARPGGLLVQPVAQLMTLAFVYYAVLPSLGYLLSTLIAMPLCLYIFRNRSGAALLVYSLLIPLILQLLFFQLLGIYPIVGARVDLLEAIGQ